MNLGTMMLADMSEMNDRIQELYKIMGGWLIPVILGAALFLGLWMGSGFWLADGDEQKLKKAKSRVKFFIIGWIIIFVVVACLPVFVGALQTWAQGG